jgi:hypothetical protein
MASMVSSHIFSIALLVLYQLFLIVFNHPFYQLMKLRTF